MAFCKDYNAQTAKMAGDVVPVEITVYEVRQGAASAPRHLGLSAPGARQRQPPHMQRVVLVPPAACVVPALCQRAPANL
jgi:hypothetical protein